MIMDRSIRLAAAVLFCLIILMSISISWAFMTLILGLLLIPPIAATVHIFIQGIPLIRREMEDLLASGKDIFLISVSKEYIALEPQFR